MIEVELGFKVPTLSSVIAIEKTIVITASLCWMTIVIFYCRSIGVAVDFLLNQCCSDWRGFFKLFFNEFPAINYLIY